MPRLILAFFLSILGYGQIMSPIVAGSGGAFTLTATTVGSSKTVTITRLTLNGAATLNWGDGSTTVITSQNTGAWTHVYATGGTYTIKLPNARMIVGLQLSDAQLGGMNTNQLRSSSINYFYVTAITGSTIRSADMSAWRPATWYLYSMPTGTYTISSSDMSAWTTTQIIYLYANVGQVTTINSYTNFTGLVALRNLQLQNNALTQAQVNAVLQGLWTARASFTYATPSLTINGTNAAPSGIYQTNCPTPATGKEWAYDLVHETCTGGGHPWTVTTN